MTKARRRAARGPLRFDDVSRRLAAPVALAATLALMAGACQSSSKGSTLVIVVTVSGSLPPISTVAVTLKAGSNRVSTQSYARADGQAIAFPTTLGAELPATILGELTIDVTASGPAGAAIAHGQAGITLRAGGPQTAFVRLDCNGAVCTGGGPDAATDGGDDGAAPDGWSWSCGNGRVDLGETCDTAIPAGQPGSCPAPNCDDGIACTSDVASGDHCTAACSHQVTLKFVDGDDCCPEKGTAALDRDCSPTCNNGTIEAGETCDTAIPAGQTGACPSPGDCDDHDPCTEDQLISGDTCAARCLHHAKTIQSTAPSGTATTDGCCPLGAAHADDPDCPVVCGDGLVEGDELCDTGLGAPALGACPASCDDGDPCTRDVRTGDGCRTSCDHQVITTFAPGDGCCPAGANHNADSDCSPVCGNGALEIGETCDKGIPGGAGACPTACPSPSMCIRRQLVGDAARCNARCTTTLVTACSLQRDGCCPAGCTSATDADCSSTCGNGQVEAPGETCDIAAAAGSGAACPQSCAPCTDVLIGAGTCQAACVFLPVTDFKPGDGCCPPGGTFAQDADCPATCGNGVAEPPFEICDAPTMPQSCAVSCPLDTACTAYRLAGAAGSCDLRCVVAAQVTACRSGDGCCPPGCSAAGDTDCAPVCGNGVLEDGERCDKGITTGQPGACDRSCDDLDPCTADFSSGTVEGCTRTCTHVPITACAHGDRCCPRGCTATNDHDCLTACTDSVVEQGETCDPPSTCPTACPDDGDRCTIDHLVGDPRRCTSACVHTPITACSGTKADLCCPTGCDAKSDIDC